MRPAAGVTLPMTLGDSLPPFTAVKTGAHAPTEAATMTFSPAQRAVSEIIRGQSGRAALKTAGTILADPLSVEIAAKPGGDIGSAEMAVT